MLQRVRAFSGLPFRVAAACKGAGSLFPLCSCKSVSNSRGEPDFVAGDSFNAPLRSVFRNTKTDSRFLSLSADSFYTNFTHFYSLSPPTSTYGCFFVSCVGGQTDRSCPVPHSFAVPALLEMRVGGTKSISVVTSDSPVHITVCGTIPSLVRRVSWWPMLSPLSLFTRLVCRLQSQCLFV